MLFSFSLQRKAFYEAKEMEGKQPLPPVGKQQPTSWRPVKPLACHRATERLGAGLAFSDLPYRPPPHTA